MVSACRQTPIGRHQDDPKLSNLTRRRSSRNGDAGKSYTSIKKEAQNGFPRQKNSSNTAGTQNATVTDAVVGAVVTRDDDDRSKRLGQGESGSRATPSLRDVERRTRRDQGKPRSVQEQSGRQYHRRNRFRGGKNSAYTAPVGFLLGWRNTSRNGRENRALVTTSHVFLPNKRRKAVSALPISLRNSGFSGGSYCHTRIRGAGGVR